MSKLRCVGGVAALVMGFLAFTMLGIILPTLLPGMIEDGLNEQLILTPESQQKKLDIFNWFQSSKSAKAPEVYVSVWFHELLNADTWLTTGETPVVREKGPYVFRKHRERFNITFGVDNKANRKIVSYNEWIYFTFDQQRSAPGLTLDQNVTVVSPLFIGMCSALLPLGLGDVLLSYFPSRDFTEARRLTINRPARDVLFGYFDTDYGRNQASPAILENKTFEEAIAAGTYVRYTGEGDPAWATLYKQFQGMEYVEADESLLSSNKQLIWGTYEANQVWGTDGEQFRRGLKRGDNVTAFNDDTMRSIQFRNLDNEVSTFRGIEMLRMSVDPDIFLPTSQRPANAPYYNDGPGGVFNLTRARSGVPVFASLPHFYLAEPVYRQRVAGMSPTKEQHDLFLGVEPITGLVMHARKRAQVNFHVQPANFTTLFSGAQHWFSRVQPHTLIPLMWFEESGDIDSDSASEFRSQIYLANSLLSVGKWTGVAIGALFMLIGIVAISRRDASLASRNLNLNEHLITSHTSENEDIGMQFPARNESPNPRSRY